MPPTNHLANGELPVEDRVPRLDHSTSSAAWRAQNPSSSSAASSYRYVPTTSASSLNASDGGNLRFSAISASIVSCCSLIESFHRVPRLYTTHHGRDQVRFTRCAQRSAVLEHREAAEAGRIEQRLGLADPAAHPHRLEVGAGGLRSQ